MSGTRIQADAPAPLLAVENVTLQYKTEHHLVTATWRVGFEIFEGERFVLLGPSGCGKSTLLKAVAGFMQPVEGEIRLGGKRIDRPGSDRMMVFQEFDQLLPWKTVLGNVAMGPQFQGVSKKEAQAEAREWLRRVGLTGFEDHHPHQLSGGMRKRTSLAAALINKPSILLMDEPFGALDVQTKAIMSNELLGLWEQTRPSVLFITHDLEEAVALADKVVVMTVGPGTVKGVFDIDLPRPRGAVQEIRFDARFLELHHQIWDSLREEVQRAYERTATASSSDGASR